MGQHQTDVNPVFMQRALELATRAQGYVSPNPMVGCVVVHDGNIIGEGFHQRYGQAHAEVNAIASVSDRAKLKDSTVYVTLEPCSHFGKTPPCADLLIREGVKRVVVACEDVNSEVSGRGIRKLREAGIEVEVGIMESEAKFLNRRFIHWMQHRKPYVILKWAQTSDGFIAREDGSSKWISDAYSRQLVHQWRAQEDGILIGSGTVRADNPRLNVRMAGGRDPVRIIIDRKHSLPDLVHVFDGSQKTICYTTNYAAAQGQNSWVKLEGEDFIEALLGDLYEKKIQSVIVEGGAAVFHAFANHWQEARVFESPATFGTGIPAPKLTGSFQTRQLRNDVLKTYYNHG